jgi:DNA-binding GntR family transcriptional regulator
VTQTPHPKGPTTRYAEGFNHEPLRQRVATVIRDAILEGKLLPGAPLVEKAIADDLEISRAPVREAIRMLVKEGLVESIAYKGSRVRRLSQRDVQEVYAMRGLLERYAVRQYFEHDTGDRLLPLESACDDMERAAEAADIKALSDADERFHRSLIDLARNEMLLGMWTLIGLRARHAMALRNHQVGDLRLVAGNHRTIVEALAARELETSLQLVTAHIDSGAQLILDDWETAA